MPERKISGPIARSPIVPAPPIAVQTGWEVSARSGSAPLRIIDCTPGAKILVRATPHDESERALGVTFGQAARDCNGTLIVGSSPGDWMLLGKPGSAAQIAEGVPRGSFDSLVTVIDVTHGRLLLRLAGSDSTRLIGKLCPIDLSDRVMPNGAAFRSSLAGLVVDVVRDDVRILADGRNEAAEHGAERSYLLHCDRSSGQYLFGVLLDAGAEYGIDIAGFSGCEI